MIDDSELLRRYAESRSQDAFAEVVRRHVDLVYGVALRKLGGDTHLARDAAQRVFIDLARKSGALHRHPAITAWLFTSAQFAATQLVRAEARRRTRETKAELMNAIARESAADPAWELLRPALDDAISELNERDRDAVALRFFEGCSFAVIGARLGLSEDGARSRVERALEKLRARLQRRGFASTAAALAAGLTPSTAFATPAGLAGTITKAALNAHALGIGAGTATAIAFMSATKIVTGIAAAAAVAIMVIRLAEDDGRQAAKPAAVAPQLDARPVSVPAAQPGDSPSVRATASVPSDNVVRHADVPKEGTTSRQTSPSPAAVQAVVRPPPLELTKEALARVVSLTGVADLGPEHVANIRAWALADPEGMVRWVATLPTSKQREHTTEAIIAIEKDTNPELAFLLANSISEMLPRMNRLADVVRVWAPRDPEAAARAVASAEITEDYRQRLLRRIERANQ